MIDEGAFQNFSAVGWPAGFVLNRLLYTINYGAHPSAPRVRVSNIYDGDVRPTFSVGNTLKLFDGVDVFYTGTITTVLYFAGSDTTNVFVDDPGEVGLDTKPTKQQIFDGAASLSITTLADPPYGYSYSDNGQTISHDFNL